MSLKLSHLISDLEPPKTVLLFGSGSSIPSGGPSVDALIKHFAKTFDIPQNDYSLSEIATLAEAKSSSRKKIISELRKLCASLQPTGGLRNLPLYNWRSIYTTNYDTLIEQTYDMGKKSLRVYSSNFDFTTGDETTDCVLFKLHGTIEKDGSDGANSQIVLTQRDYEQTKRYREQLYDRLKADLAGSNLVIIGNSLSDPDIKEIVNRAATLNAEAMGSGRVWLLMFVEDENRALLYEGRAISVCFGGIDDFFAALPAQANARTSNHSAPDDPLDIAPGLRPVTIEVAHALQQQLPNIGAMFNGWPATYGDIKAGYAFPRKISKEIVEHFDEEKSLCVTMLGASGVGKSTAAKQALIEMTKRGYQCWEHNSDHTLNAEAWYFVAVRLKEKGEVGALLIDNAHQHLQGANDLADRLVASNYANLKLILISSRNHWYPRIKSPSITRFSKTVHLSRLTETEIDGLLDLLDRSIEVRNLVEDQFSGYDRTERRRRLVVRCNSDMFVCLKNIFASDSFDNIILQEFAGLEKNLQEVFRYVAAMETAGVRVHRQLVVRLLGIQADHISATLDGLTDIVIEYTIDDKLGIYGWRCRHPVISAIITKYKFQNLERTIELFEKIIDNIFPTYDIEIRSLRELCNIASGLPRISDKNIQNRLLRKMISNAPGERVPRHRLVRNLIEQGHFEKAETEIRLFDKDFGSDGPVHRYKIRLMVERAVRTPNILPEDRIAILEQAHDLAVAGVSRYTMNTNILGAYADLGIEYYKMTGRFTYYDEAINFLKEVEEESGDPQVSAIIARYGRRMSGHYVEPDETQPEAASELDIDAST